MKEADESKSMQDLVQDSVGGLGGYNISELEERKQLFLRLVQT